jgi:predicted dehydrogenase
LEVPKTRIKIGQIGVGHAHASKLEVYRASADYEVVGIVEPDSRLRQRAESQSPYRDLPWMTQEKLLGTPGLQAVLVETRVRDLLTTAEACVAAGKHVHIDKPAGESLPQLKKILDDATRQKLMVQMGYMYRYNPGVLLLKQFLTQKWLGEIFEVHTVMSKVVSTSERKQLAKFKGGIMFELGCHITDLVIGVLGKPTKVEGFKFVLLAIFLIRNDFLKLVVSSPNLLKSTNKTSEPSKLRYSDRPVESNTVTKPFITGTKIESNICN